MLQFDCYKIATNEYPGKRVVNDGKRTMDQILLYISDHTAFLNAFTEAEDDLLDWSEDFREVSFFFANQKTIFDNAWKLCEKLQQEQHYFSDEPDAKTAARSILEILRMEKPYRRIVEIPTHTMYIVESTFSSSARETVCEKVKRLILGSCDVPKLEIAS